MNGVLRDLTALRDRSDELSKSLAELSGRAGVAASSLTAGGATLGEALRRALPQMNGIIEDYTSYLERTTSQLAERR
jgi:ABC-type transporter Mla subunit MlaD